MLCELFDNDNTTYWRRSLVWILNYDVDCLRYVICLYEIMACFLHKITFSNGCAIEFSCLFTAAPKFAVVIKIRSFNVKQKSVVSIVHQKSSVVTLNENDDFVYYAFTTVRRLKTKRISSCSFYYENARWKGIWRVLTPRHATKNSNSAIATPFLLYLATLTNGTWSLKGWKVKEVANSILIAVE